MTKLTTERLEKLQDDLLQFQDSYSDPADKENYDIFVDALHVLDEFKAAKEKLIAYEQAAEKPYGYLEPCDFPRTTATVYPEKDKYAFMPLYAAPVLPKQPEPENKIAQIKRQKALAWLKRVAYENPCMKEVKTCIEVLSAPAQPVSEPKAEGDFLSRLKAEHVELEDRYIKLANFIQVNPEFKKLAPRMQRLLENQTAAMVDYASILECRIDLIEDAAASAQEQK